MYNWFFRQISDYWDNQSQNNIFKYSQIIGSYPPDKQGKVLQEIREAIFEHVAVMNGEQLSYAAFIIADDIYKSANEIGIFNSYISEYLEASAGTCHENNESYFNLQIDGGERHFTQCFTRVKDKGIITVFRSEPPVSGTKCNVIFPEEKF